MVFVENIQELTKTITKIGSNNHNNTDIYLS